MSNKNNDCLTKSDVKEFFNNLGEGILIVGLVVMATIGFVTTITAGISWLKRPSKIEVLADKVDDLQHEVRLNNPNGSSRVIYYSTDTLSSDITHSHGASH